MKLARIGSILTLLLMLGFSVSFAATRSVGGPSPMHIPDAQPAAPNQAGSTLGTFPGSSPGTLRPSGGVPTFPPRPLRRGHVVHIKMVNGGDIALTPGAGCGTASGANDVVLAGCSMGWTSTNLPAGTHKDYQEAVSSGSALAVGGTYTTSSGVGHTTVFNSAGVHVFGSYNQTTSAWDALVYLDVANGLMTITTYADQYMKTPQQNFTAGSTIYVNVANATANENQATYALYAENVSQNGNCVWTWPAPASMPVGNALCAPTTSPGITATYGSIFAAWNTTGVATGQYQIVLFNQTDVLRQGKVNVTITGAGATAFTLYPTAGNASPSPAATPAGSLFAFNSTSDQSDSGITGTVTAPAASTAYKVVVTNPAGHPVANISQTSSASKVVSFSWSFGSSQTPEYFSNPNYAIQLYDPAGAAVDAISSFQIVGYSADVELGGNSNSLQVVAGSATPYTQSLVLKNNSSFLHGMQNGASIAEFLFSTANAGTGHGILANINCNGTGQPVCTTNANTENVTDTAGGTWQIVQANTTPGGTDTSYTTFTVTPVAPTVSLAPGASITIPGVQFTAPTLLASCSSGCNANTFVLPVGGVTWSNSSVTANNLVFNTVAAATGAVTGTLTFYGANQTTTKTNQDVHGVTPHLPQALYVQNSPGQTIQNYWTDIVGVTINSSLSSAITELQFEAPSSVPTLTVDPLSLASGSGTWTIVACPVVAKNTVCINGGSIAPATPTTVYLDMTMPLSAQYFDNLRANVLAPTIVPITSSSTATIPSGTPASVNAMQIGFYNLDASEMNAAFNAGSGVVSAAQNVTLQFAQEPPAAGALVDPVDYIVLETTLTFTPGTMPSNWYYAGSTTHGGNNEYWFTVCSGYTPANANGPWHTPNTAPTCGTASQELNSLTAGNVVAFPGSLTTGAAGGQIAQVYAHGANGNGWTNAIPVSMTLGALSASAGFISSGPSGSLTTFAAGNQPQVGADYSATSGTQYDYRITNTGTTSVTSATITVPGENKAGQNGSDSASYPWTLVAPNPSISGAAHGCSVASSSSATSGGANGSISITGCTLAQNQSIDVLFNAHAPYRVNDTYTFSTTVNAGTAAQELWTTDTTLQMILTGSLVITVNPTGPPAPSCTGCSYGASYVTFPGVNPGSSETGSDVVLLNVTTDAGGPQYWKLQVQADVNDNNELETAIDDANSCGGALVLLCSQVAVKSSSSYSVIPTTSPLTLVDTSLGSQLAVNHNAFPLYTNYEIVSPSNDLAKSHTSNLTYTWIPE